MHCIHILARAEPIINTTLNIVFVGKCTLGNIPFSIPMEKECQKLPTNGWHPWRQETKFTIAAQGINKLTIHV
jgi:hypothetical protein